MTKLENICEMQERKQVNYDYLVETGAINVRKAIERILTFRAGTWGTTIREGYNRDVRRVYLTQEELEHVRQEVAFVVSARENWDNVVYTHISRHPVNVLPSRMDLSLDLLPLRTRKHVSGLVGRCLAGYDVPDDVCFLVNGCGLRTTNPVVWAIRHLQDPELGIIFPGISPSDFEA